MSRHRPRADPPRSARRRLRCASPPPASPSSSGMSTTTAPVVSTKGAMLAAFCRTLLTILSRSMIPPREPVVVLAGRGIVAEGSIALETAGDRPFLAGDKGYSHEGIRDWLREHAIKAVAPRRKDQRHDDRRHRLDRKLHRRRCVMERCVGWLKECRRLSTQFEKPAMSILAMLHLAFIERDLRVPFSDTTQAPFMFTPPE